jgi:hypothetical protein
VPWGSSFPTCHLALALLAKCRVDGAAAASCCRSNERREGRSVHFGLDSALFRMRASAPGWKTRGGLALACRWWP